MPIYVPDVKAFGAALATAMADRGLRAPAIAKALGISDDAVRKWMTGLATPEPLRVFGLEQLLELAPGSLSHHLGYLPLGEPSSVEEAVDADPRLSPLGRAAVLGTYRAVRE